MAIPIIIGFFRIPVIEFLISEKFDEESAGSFDSITRMTTANIL